MLRVRGARPSRVRASRNCSTSPRVTCLMGLPTASKNFAAQRRYVARVLGRALRISKASDSFDNRGSVVVFIAHSVMGAPKSGRAITVGERGTGRNGARPERSLLWKTAGDGEMPAMV